MDRHRGGLERRMISSRERTSTAVSLNSLKYYRQFAEYRLWPTWFF